jgi:hypothetical protein
MQNVLRAVRRPDRQHTVIGIGQSPATANGNQAGIADRTENHEPILWRGDQLPFMPALPLIVKPLA